jgi:hypothetical protein
MRIIPLIALFAGCSEAPPATPPPQEPAPSPWIEKIRAGEAPPEIEKEKDPRIADEIAKAVVAKKAWKTEGDRVRALKHLSANARKEHVEALFVVMETEKPEPALGAIFALAPLVTAEHHGRIDALLGGKDDVPAGRAVMLLGESRNGAALLEKHAAGLLARKGLAKAVLHAIGTNRAKGATSAVIDYYAAKDDEACLKALGRVWQQAADAKPLPKEEESTRTLVYVLLHRYATTPLATKENVDAMFRVMTSAELDDFLAKHAKSPFVARKIAVEVAGVKGFDRVKGLKIHSALLQNADAVVVAMVLYTSPYALDKATVKALLDRADEVKSETLPKETKLCDFAAVRLARMAGEEAEMPPTAEGRAKLVARMR